MTIRHTALITVLFVLFCLVSVLGLPAALGAHPWWAAKSGVIGSLLGAAFVFGWWLMVKETRFLPWIALVSLGSSTLAAVLGKQVFVASFAENAVAGRFWFFGWFGLSASLFVLIVALLLSRLER